MWEPPCYPTAPTPWNTLPATSTGSCSEEWKPVPLLEFSKLTQAAAHKNKPGLSRQEHSAFLTAHERLCWSLKGREQPGLNSTAGPGDTWLLQSSLPQRAAINLSLLQMAAGILMPRKSNFTGSLGKPGRLRGFLFPPSCQWMFMVQLWGQGLPSPARAVGSAFWKQGMSEASFRPWVAFWTPWHPFEVKDGNPAPS